MRSFPGLSNLTFRAVAIGAAGSALAACATVSPQYPTRASLPRDAGPSGYKVGQPYQVGGIWYYPHEQPNYDQTGVASWYGDEFHLKPTADGEIFDKDAPSAAHTTLPLPSLVEVTNLDNGRKLVVRVNDRGPFVGGRIIDLSHEAARELGYDRAGLAHVRVRYVGPAPVQGEESLRYARYTPPATGKPPRHETASPPRKPKLATPEVVFTAQPLPPASGSIAVAELRPLPDLRPKSLRSAEASSGFRVQAGAFSTPENAERAAAKLASAGPTAVEPISHAGGTLWRVVLSGAADEDAAEALREKAAQAGFADARVLRPF